MLPFFCRLHISLSSGAVGRRLEGTHGGDHLQPEQAHQPAETGDSTDAQVYAPGAL